MFGGAGRLCEALWFAAVGGSVPNAPRRGQDPSLRCKGYGVVMARWRAGHARPLRTAVNGLWTRGAREGGSPLLFPLTGCRGRLRAAYMPPLQSSRYRHRGFGGAWRRTTSAASLQANSLVRLFAPQGQTLLAPQFRSAQLWPRARNPATPDSKVEEGPQALSANSNTAFA